MAGFTYEVLIREAHLDTFGHVNNATYFQLFEEARWEFITARGYGLREVQARKQGPIVLDAQIKFLQELKLREIIRIESECLAYEKKTGKIQQKMVKPDGTVACEVSFTFAFFDLAARRIIPPTPEWLRACGLGE
jgi:YbgC/YbaW family acyl-CoA thioester hydrolase